MIDIGTVLDLIDHLVDTHGDTHRTFPTYVHSATGQPNCLVGKVLHLLGLSVSELAGLGSTLFEHLTDDRLGLQFTLGARMALVAAQKAQDGRVEVSEGHLKGTWGQARSEAYRVAEKLLALIPVGSFDETPAAARVPVRELVFA